MKKGIIITGAVIILFIGALITLATVDFNRIGKDHAYVQITTPAEIEETKLDSGEIMKRYKYTMDAVKENGEQIEVEFSANKELREDAYLRLYLKGANSVTSYDEVQLEELPGKSKNKFVN